MQKRVIFYSVLLLLTAGCAGKTPPPPPQAGKSAQEAETGRKKIHLKPPQYTDRVQVEIFKKKELTEKEIKRKEDLKKQRLAKKERKRKYRKTKKPKPKPKPFVVGKKERVPVQITLESLEQEISWPIYRKPRVDTAFTPPAPETDAKKSRIALQLDRNFGEWTSETNPEKKGTQLLYYYSVGQSKPRYGASFFGSWVTTTYSYRDASMKDLDLGTTLDSTISTYYKFENLLGFGVRTGLDLNLPTGQSSFTGDEQSAMYPMSSIAPELFTVSSYGTGFNVAPNFVAIKPLGKKTAVGLGLRYEYTGEYDPTADIPDDTLNPGDTLMLIGSLQRVLSSTTFFLLDYSSVYATRDTMGGIEAFKQGASANYSLKIIKNFSKYRATLGGSLGTQSKSEGYDGTAFTTEERNSNNNRQEAFINILYPYSKKLAVTAIVLYKEIQKNEYNTGDLLYDAGYNATRYGLGLSYETGSGVVITSSVRKLELSNKADSQETADTKYNALTGDIGVIYFVPR